MSSSTTPLRTATSILNIWLNLHLPNNVNKTEHCKLHKCRIYGRAVALNDSISNRCTHQRPKPNFLKIVKIKLGWTSVSILLRQPDAPMETNSRWRWSSGQRSNDGNMTEIRQLASCVHVRKAPASSSPSTHIGRDGEVTWFWFWFYPNEQKNFVMSDRVSDSQRLHSFVCANWKCA